MTKDNKSNNDKNLNDYFNVSVDLFWCFWMVFNVFSFRPDSTVHCVYGFSP